MGDWYDIREHYDRDTGEYRVTCDVGGISATIWDDYVAFGGGEWTVEYPDRPEVEEGMPRETAHAIGTLIAAFSDYVRSAHPDEWRDVLGIVCLLCERRD